MADYEADARVALRAVGLFAAASDLQVRLSLGTADGLVNACLFDRVTRLQMIQLWAVIGLFAFSFQGTPIGGYLRDGLLGSRADGPRFVTFSGQPREAAGCAGCAAHGADRVSGAGSQSRC